MKAPLFHTNGAWRAMICVRTPVNNSLMNILVVEIEIY